MVAGEGGIRCGGRRCRSPISPAAGNLVRDWLHFSAHMSTMRPSVSWLDRYNLVLIVSVYLLVTIHKYSPGLAE
jgi:hypothetical protein